MVKDAPEGIICPVVEVTAAPPIHTIAEALVLEMIADRRVG
jgi:hypothetical protein